MSMVATQFRINNFDLIRLFAATQVVLHHAAHFLQVDIDSTAFWLTTFFPGVPMFFFVSGFLISKSYESNSNGLEYASNRILRIYPALWACLVVSVVAVAATGYFAQQGVDVAEFSLWMLAQSTIVQFYNPEFLRGFGVGVLNGSLWTITVELQFYLIIPILYWCFSKLELTHSEVNRTLLLLIVIFLGVSQAHIYLASQFSEQFLHRLVEVTFAPWLYMFLLGMLAQRNFKVVHRYLAGKFLLLFIGYLLIAVLVSFFQVRIGNRINPVMFVLLCATLFSFAYSFPSLSSRLLSRNDFSYGIYIYHMPVVNLIVFLGLGGQISYYALALGVTAVLAVISWFSVERPAIRLKRHPLHPLAKAKNAETRSR